MFMLKVFASVYPASGSTSAGQRFSVLLIERAQFFHFPGATSSGTTLAQRPVEA
jgi:hypothetical protein